MLFIGKKKKVKTDEFKGKQMRKNIHLQTLLFQTVLNLVCMFDWVDGRRCESKEGLGKVNTK